MKTETIILLGMLLTIMVLIHKVYQMPLNGKTFLINSYLYIIFSFIFIALIGKYTETMPITDRENMWKLVLLYFALGFGGICMMVMSESSVGRHTGFLLLLSGIALVIGSVFKYSSNVFQAAAITAGMVSIITFVIFISSEETLMKMKGWTNTLHWLLWIAIIAELAYILIVGVETPAINSVISMAIIGLFVFFILSDTSELLIKSKNLKCKEHSCVNYPLESSSLMLDYLNIFVRLTNHK